MTQNAKRTGRVSEVETKDTRCRQVLDIFRPWAPVCSGHGVPMKLDAKGYRCRVKARYNKRRSQFAGGREAYLARLAEYKTRPEVAEKRKLSLHREKYSTRRRRELESQRELIINQLEALHGS